TARSVWHGAHSRDINFRLSQGRCRKARRITQFRYLDDFRQHFLDMWSLPDAIDIGGLRSQAQDDITDCRFAARVTVTMEQREQERAGAAVHILAAKEHALPRHKNIVKYNIRIRISHIEPSLEMLAFTKRMDMDDLLHPFMIGRHRKS